MSGTTSIKEVWEVVCVEAIAEQNQKGDLRTDCATQSVTVWRPKVKLG